MSSSSGPTRYQIDKAARERLLEVLRADAEIMGPVRKGETDLLKTILSLSSAAMVLTVTLGGSAFARPMQGSARILLGIGLTALSLSMVAAVVSLWRMIRVVEFGARLYGRIPFAIDKLFAHLSAPREVPKPEIRPELQDAADKTISAAKGADWFLMFAMVAFLCGILAIAGLAVVLYVV